MKRGLVIGKFYPFHRGHAYLIEAAIRGSDEVTVLVCDRSDQVIPVEERARWIKESFPSVQVAVIPDIGHDDDSALWADYTRQVLGFSPETVFTSESYGDAYAKFLGADHVSVDRVRETVPISGTKLRKNLSRYWKYLMPGAKARFVKRVAIVGPESTGKTTLSRKLAEYYKTSWVPEYGRFFSEGKQPSGTGWESKEFEVIAGAQNRMEDALARSANRVLICDTDAFATGIWHWRYMGHPSASVDAYAFGRKYDLYLLTAPDVPFVQDGYRDGEYLREAMFERFRKALDSDGKPYVTLRGSYGSRFSQAKTALDGLLSDGRFRLDRFPKTTRWIGS